MEETAMNEKASAAAQPAMGWRLRWQPFFLPLPLVQKVVRIFPINRYKQEISDV
jgi:hypothetical protein